ncbi:MAG TPA: MBL fold metallo-hydrolase [Acidimicrobiia bacterium]|nr:MBL fold metallo-hydrolase [Acidimicrobiia bacterium]
MARFELLFAGYVSPGVASSVSFVADGDHRIVIDPGMVPNRAVILDPLRALGVDPDSVTDVVFSHHHPDHTLNAALFANARFHDHWAIYQDDVWTDRPAEGFQVSPGVRLVETPGHTPQDISTLITTPAGVVACTHLWWNGDVEGDPRATNPELLGPNRERLRALADLIVPGHGEPFEV